MCPLQPLCGKGMIVQSAVRVHLFSFQEMWRLFNACEEHAELLGKGARKLIKTCTPENGVSTSNCPQQIFSLISLKDVLKLQFQSDSLCLLQHPLHNYMLCWRDHCSKCESVDIITGKPTWDERGDEEEIKEVTGFEVSSGRGGWQY